MRSPLHHSPRGVALVTVLAFLVLVTIMALAFFTSISGEVTTAQSHAEIASVRQSSDSAIQYVIGQLRKATSGDTKETWASQPGMIRTYGDNGALRSVYKLYSSDAMEVSGVNTFNASSDMPPRRTGRRAPHTGAI